MRLQRTGSAPPASRAAGLSADTIDRNPLHRKGRHGGPRNLERFSEGQPRQHSHPGLSGHRVGGEPVLQPAPRRVPDPHPAEAVVPQVRARGAADRGGQGLRVREGSLRRDGGGGLREGLRAVDARHQPRAVHRRDGDRSDVRGPRLLPRARRTGGRRCLRRDARRHARQGRASARSRSTGANIWSRSSRSSTGW